jgi:hypothetical protein
MVQCSSVGCSIDSPVEKYTPLEPEFGHEGKHFVSGNSLFFYFWTKPRGVGGAHRSVWRVNVPKKTGARSTRARTRCQNPLVVSQKTTFKVWTNHFILPVFSAEFRSVRSFGIGSSAELGMHRNEHFLPQNNGNRSESIPRNFFGTKFCSQP